jgi:tubulin-specific chaperone A
LIKEVQYYKDEVKENEMKLAKMKEEQKDEYDIKKFQEVLDESIMMVPDSETRLGKALDDLKQFMDGDSCKELNNEWMDKAQSLLRL